MSGLTLIPGGKPTGGDEPAALELPRPTLEQLRERLMEASQYAFMQLAHEDYKGVALGFENAVATARQMAEIASQSAPAA